MSLTQKISQIIALSCLISGSFIPTAFSSTVPQDNLQETKSETLLAQTTVNTDDLRFQIRNCNRTRKEVICGVVVTNISEKNRKVFFLNSDGRAIDTYGDTYSLQKITLGKKNSIRRNIATTLTPGIPTKLNYYFPIPQGVNQLAGIELNYSYGYGKNKVGLRNIPIGNYRGVRRRRGCTCD